MLFSLAVSTVLAMGCASTRFPVVPPTTEKKDRSQIARVKAQEYFIAARDRERRGRLTEARILYELAYEHDPESRELMGHVVRYCMNAGEFGRALSLVRKRERFAALNADDHRIISGIYWKAGDILKAIETTEKIADKEDYDYYSLAAMSEAAGNAEKALGYYREYYRRNDSSQELALKIIRMQYVVQQYDFAESLSIVVQERHGESAALYDLRGLLAMAQGDTARALALFESAISLDSLYESALRNAAMVHMQRNEHGKAIEYYEMLYRNLGAYKNEYGRMLAMLYYYGGRYDEAAQLMFALAEGFIGDPDFHLHLGQIFAAMGKNERARIEIEKSVALNENNADAWRELIHLSLREKDYERAFEKSKRYLARFPKDVASWRLTGYVVSLKKNYNEALVYFNKALVMDSADAGGWFDLGSCYERSGDITRAASAFRRVLRLRPGDPAAANYLGYMWAEKGINLDSAQILLELALSKEPSNGAFLDSYAWIFYQKGDLDKAYRYIMDAVARISNDPVIFEHLGDISFKRGDSNGAMRAYLRSLEYNPDNIDQLRKKVIDIEAGEKIY